MGQPGGQTGWKTQLNNQVGITRGNKYNPDRVDTLVRIQVGQPRGQSGGDNLDEVDNPGKQDNQGGTIQGVKSGNTTQRGQHTGS